MSSVKEITHSIRFKRASAQQTVFHYLQIIRQYDPPINSVTRILDERALKAAERIDHLIAIGQDPGLLAGVPFAVKDLFDVQDEITTAGSKILSKKPCASQDAEVIQRLCAAGAIPIATLNMDEFAYGFVTDNAHHGMTRNPHDLLRFAGGSSGGSAASVGGGIVPFSLGSDTNGSIRVPASLCGVWGIRSTFDLMPMQGVYPFAKSFDTIGPFCQTVEDLKLVFNIMAGIKHTASDLPMLSNLRIAQVGGWFERDVEQDILQAIQDILSLFGQQKKIELPHIEQVRTASYLMTASEGGNLHLPNLRTQPLDYDPATRDRLMAGSMLPVASYLQAQKIQTWFQNYLKEIFQNFDLLIAPAVGSAAPKIDTPIVYVDGNPAPARVHLGIYTQPFSMCKCPILSIPLQRQGKLPVGLQLIAQSHQEELLFAVGAILEQRGLAKASIIQNESIA